MRLRERRQAWGMGSFEEGGEGGSRSRGLVGEWSFALFGGLPWVSAFMYFTLSVLTMIMDLFALVSFFHLLRIVVCIVLSSSIEQSKFNLKQTEEATSYTAADRQHAPRRPPHSLIGGRARR
jgi:hypothetical protein